MLLFIRRKGQGVSAEYVFLLALVSIAIVGMTVYVRRAIQARYRDGNRVIYWKATQALGTPVQIEYEPYYANTTADVDVSSLLEQRAVAGDAMERTTALDRSVNMISTQVPY